MKSVRVAVVCDLREEGWHSMDLFADMLLSSLPSVAGDAIQATRLCPSMARRVSTLPLIGTSSQARLADRLMGRLWDYPRWLAPLRSQFDVFHIVDHSYAHLVRVLPADRTVTTCHDIDAVRAALPGGSMPVHPSRLLASHLLDGLRQSAVVACVSRSTENQLASIPGIERSRLRVVYAGVHPSCTPQSNAHDASVRIPGDDSRTPVILHVGSTIARKRIDVLLEVLAGVRTRVGDVRLIRAGGLLTVEQRALARQLGVMDAIVEMPFLERPQLAALYRRAALVMMPSDREGFGLPIVESMACGTPVVASAIPALEEVGGNAATYCPPGDVSAWTEAVASLLRERETDPASWETRRRKGVASAARFSWESYASDMTKIYLALAS